jgi:hypothetical protein
MATVSEFQIWTIWSTLKKGFELAVLPIIKITGDVANVSHLKKRENSTTVCTSTLLPPLLLFALCFNKSGYLLHLANDIAGTNLFSGKRLTSRTLATRSKEQPVSVLTDSPVVFEPKDWTILLSCIPKYFGAWLKRLVTTTRPRRFGWRLISMIHWR